MRVRAYQAADAQLNSLSHEARQRIGDDTERAWVAFRDAESTFAASV